MCFEGTPGLVGIHTDSYSLSPVEREWLFYGAMGWTEIPTYEIAARMW